MPGFFSPRFYQLQDADTQERCPWRTLGFCLKAGMKKPAEAGFSMDRQNIKQQPRRS
jgi:hypothetical protein